MGSVGQRIAPWWAVGLVLLACASPAERPLPRFLAPPPPQADPFANWSVPPGEAERLLASGGEVLRERRGAGGGTTGALRLTLHYPEAGRELRVKWKKAPTRTLDGFNNAPRKELAAYAVQKLFLDPEDYVVPTTVARCVPLAVYRARHGRGTPSLPSVRCVLGVASLWLEDVTAPDELYEESRFLEDPAYAYHLANLNLLTYLLDHRDGRRGNFLASRRGPRRVYSVDNGVSLDPFPWNFFVRNWNRIRVPALPRPSVERLRRLRREDLSALAVLAQFERDEDAMLRAAPPGPALDPRRGVSMRGDTLQLGLSAAEIDGIHGRIQQLLDGVDAGRYPLF